MKMKPDSYLAFDGGEWVDWTHGDVDVDFLSTLQVNKSRVVVNGIQLYAISFDENYIWICTTGWVGDRKPMAVTPRSFVR